MSHFVLHQFRPSETINAVIRLRGRHNYTQEEILILQEKFNELNGTRVPRPGDVYKIPIEGLITDDFGELLDVTASPVIDGPVVTDPGGNGEQPPQCQHSGDPSQPVHQHPPQPVASEDPQQAAEQHRNQQVAPNSSKDADQHVDTPHVQPVQQPILSISGPRRRKPVVR